jgi:lipoate synthase
MHAPEQAFINIEPTCDRGCLFCSADTERDLDWTAARWIKLIVETYRKKPFEAVAITAGMPHGIRSMTDLMIDVVAGVRTALPQIPIGIEPNAVSREALEMLKAAGADELKINVQTATARTFKKVCPHLDRADIMRCLSDGVEVFGPGNVASNVILGLGETDKEILRCVKDLAKKGVVANLRALRVNDANIKKLEKALGKKVGVKDPQKLIFFMNELAKILAKYNLDPRSFKTMCHRCACCDLTVGTDH